MAPDLAEAVQPGGLARIASPPGIRVSAVVRGSASDGAYCAVTHAVTKQLFILRHAKSSWDDPSLSDQERPLAPRGRRAVELLAEHIRSEGVRPAQILCSDARRTRETLEGIGLDGEV